jgi:GxxExxY protein
MYEVKDLTQRCKDAKTPGKAKSFKFNPKKRFCYCCRFSFVSLRLSVLALKPLKRYVMDENELSKIIVESAIEVHRSLGGPGLLEGVYEEALVWELKQRDVMLERQLTVSIVYKGNSLATPLRLDILVENKVIIEVKSVSQYNSIFEAQALTYLRMLNLKLGLVINFGERLVKDGIHRVVNGIE